VLRGPFGEWRFLLLGFLLGVRHATDADHVVAVSAMTSRERSVGRALQVGLAWGVGHALTVLIAGGAIVLLGLRIPARLGLALEFSVALVLVVLGVMNLSEVAREARPAAVSTPNPSSPIVARLGAATTTSAQPRNALRSLGVGLVHGLAGSAAVALLVVSTLEKSSIAVIYLGVFGLGTILGMGLLTLVMAVPLAYAAERMRFKTLGLASLAGVLSLALGLVLVYRIGFVHGLFTDSPTWHPG
jgi:hypothetical protein